MSNKRRFFVAGACLAAVLACIPIETAYAAPQETAVDVQEITADTQAVMAAVQAVTTDAQAVTADVPVLETVSAAYDSVTLGWTPVEGATSYKLQRSTNQKTAKTLARIKAGNTLQYTAGELYSAKKYYFRVIATCQNGETKTSEWYMVKPMMDVPATVSLEHLGFGQIQMSWATVAGAGEYRIYRSATETGGYKRLADVTTAAYTDTVETGATYYYKVVGIRVNPSGKRVRGTVSPAYKIEVASDIPQILSATGTTYSMTIQWGSVDHADEYVVYRSTKKGSGYKQVTSTTNTTWTDSGVTAGTRYYYKVAVGHKIDGTMKYGTRSAAMTAWTAPPAPEGLTATQSAGGIDLKWTASQGAKTYKVYRAVAKSSSYTLLADNVKKAAYTDTVITAGEDYSYYVVAVRDTLTGGRSASAAVHIDEIKVNTRTLFLGPGVTAVLEEQSALPGTVGFQSEDPSIAAVDANGTVTGIAPGKTQIQVTVGVVSTSVAVTVTDCPINGIDVSKWQQAIDWKTVKASGIKFAMLRLAHGTSKDIQFENYYAGATEQGIPVGIYCYTTAKSVAEGKKEAQNLLEMLDGKELTYPIALDLEDNLQIKNMNKEQRTKLVLEYKKIIEDAGYQFIVYANLNWLNNYIDQTQLEDNDVDIWIARYCSQSLGHRYTGGGNVQLWQYSSTGQIDGILDAYGRYINVDLDVCYGEY